MIFKSEHIRELSFILKISDVCNNLKWLSHHFLLWFWLVKKSAPNKTILSVKVSFTVTKVGFTICNQNFVKHLSINDVA